MLVFSLEGTASLPAQPAPAARHLAPPPAAASAETVALGAALYGQYCGVCHGDAVHSAGILPDLRYSGLIRDQEQFNNVVLDGALGEKGMVTFNSVLDADRAAAVRAYIIARANEDKKLMETAK